MTQPQRTPSQMASTETAAHVPDSGVLDQVLERTNNRLRGLRNEVEKRIDQIEELLPPIMKGQGARLAKRAVLTFARMGKDVSTCSDTDFIRGVLEAAELGLAIDGKLAYMIPYKGKWQMQLDYKGIVAVARRNKLIRDIYADVVFSNDKFSHGRHNDKSHLEHTFELGKPRGDTCRGAYAIVKLPNADWRYEVVDFADLERIRMRSPYGRENKGPWATDPNEMRKKTVVKRCLKMYCDDPAIARAIDLDDSFDHDEPEEAPAKRRVEDILNARKKAPPTNGNGGAAAAAVQKDPFSEAVPDVGENGGYDFVPITSETVAAIKAVAKEQGLDGNELSDLVHSRTDRRLLDDISQQQGQDLLDYLRGGPEPGRSA